MSAKIRLYVDHPLGPTQSVPLSRDQSHYLFGVMRQNLGDQVALFNGQDGEWLAEITTANKKNGVVTCIKQTQDLKMPPDVWLLFAPIKKARTDFIVEKATEMGVARILPVQTEYTNSDRIRQDRLQSHAIEAAEQCGGTFVPPVDAMTKLNKLLDAWPADRKLVFCDEAAAGLPDALPDGGTEPWAILIGPEGGFSDTERARLKALPFVTTLSLGPRILRADTAAVAALTMWQSQLGDWQ